MAKAVSRRALLCVLQGASLCFVTPVWAVKLKLEPSLGFKTAYADNVNAAGRTQAQHDWVVQLTPAVRVQADGARVQLSANYAMQNTLYLRHSNQNRLQHQLDTRGRAELVQDLLFVDGYANVSQQSVSPFSSGFRDDTNFAVARTDVTTLGISPYLRQRWQDHWLSEVRYTHNRSYSDVAALSDSQMDSVLLALSQNVPGKRASWGASYRYGHTSNQGVAVDFDQHNLLLNGRYRIRPKVGVLANLGYEKYNYQSIADTPEGVVADVGAFWVPNARGLLEANVGKRFYGTSYRLNGHYRLPFGSFSASYNEDIATSQSSFFLPLTVVGSNGLSPVRFNENINILSNRIFLDKRLQTAITFKESRTSLQLSADYTRRKAQNEQVLDSVLLGNLNRATTDRFSQLGLAAAWGWQFAPRTESNMSVRYRLDDFDAVNTDLEYWTFQWGVSRQFQSNLTGGLEYMHHRSEGNQLVSTYRNNSVTANIQLAF